MTATYPSLREAQRADSEARCRRELEAARLAVFVSRCATCGVLYDVRLAEPCDGAVYNVSDGICEECGDAQAKAAARSDYDAAKWSTPT